MHSVTQLRKLALTLVSSAYFLFNASGLDDPVVQGNLVVYSVKPAAVLAVFNHVMFSL